MYGATKKEIAIKSQSERNDVFKEITAGSMFQAGFSDLNIKSSIKKPLDKQSEEIFLLNIEGQSAKWNVMGQREEASQHDEKGQPNPERGKGMKYVLSKDLRLGHGLHKIFLALPAENVSYRTQQKKS